MQMKRLLVVAAILLMSAATWAQQALWGTAPVVSPEIHSDNTVTFRLSQCTGYRRFSSRTSDRDT